MGAGVRLEMQPRMASLLPVVRLHRRTLRVPQLLCSGLGVLLGNDRFPQKVIVQAAVMRALTATAREFSWQDFLEIRSI